VHVRGTLRLQGSVAQVPPNPGDVARSNVAASAVGIRVNFMAADYPGTATRSADWSTARL
jgi:hypothetical protein